MYIWIIALLFATVNTLCEKYFVIIYKTWYYGCK
nr:MAG TPA: hypothetical protein [Caudoviricetes sp.]